MVDRTATSLKARQEAALKEMNERPKTYWPSWRYGPNGESAIFQSPDEVPEGWEDHPNKVGAGGAAAKLDSVADDDARIDELLAYTQPELVAILEGWNDENDPEVEFSKSWPKLKLAKSILANGVPYEPKSED